MTNDGGPAFPTGGTHTHWDDSMRSVEHFGGMSLRDYFAAKVMFGLQTWLGMASNEMGIARQAEYAYEVADAMLKERAK